MARRIPLKACHDNRVPLEFYMGSPQATSRVTGRVLKRLFDAFSWSRLGSSRLTRPRHLHPAVALAVLPTSGRFTRPCRHKGGVLRQ
jgi:hypothetical protein